MTYARGFVLPAVLLAVAIVVGVLALDVRDRRLAGDASNLAWSEQTPEPEALSALVTQVERTVEQ